MNSVLQNAYFRKAQENNNFCEIHQRILFVLTQEKKYFTKDELLCFSNYNIKILDQVLTDLAKSKTIFVEGWLVRLIDFVDFQKEICQELVDA
jgi:hypothetical protein